MLVQIQLLATLPRFEWCDCAARTEFVLQLHCLTVDVAQGELLAFAHMRFLVEANVETIYVYEIQVKGSVRRSGLGKHLMQVHRPYS